MSRKKKQEKSLAPPPSQTSLEATQGRAIGAPLGPMIPAPKELRPARTKDEIAELEAVVRTRYKTVNDVLNAIERMNPDKLTDRQYHQVRSVLRKVQPFVRERDGQVYIRSGEFWRHAPELSRAPDLFSEFDVSIPELKVHDPWGHDPGVGF